MKGLYLHRMTVYDALVTIKKTKTFWGKTLGFITKQDLIDLGWTENTKDGNFEKNFSGMDFKLIPNGYGFIPQGNNRHFVQIDSIKDLKDFMDTL